MGGYQSGTTGPAAATLVMTVRRKVRLTVHRIAAAVASANASPGSTGWRGRRLSRIVSVARPVRVNQMPTANPQLANRQAPLSSPPMRVTACSLLVVHTDDSDGSYPAPALQTKPSVRQPPIASRLPR